MSGYSAHSHKLGGSSDEQPNYDGRVPDEGKSESAVDAVDSGTSVREGSRSRGAVCVEATLNGEKKRVRLANDVEAHMNDSIQVMEPDAREFRDEFPRFRLPGSGGLLPDCGDEGPYLFCPRCGTEMIVGRTCRRSICPRCWESWDFQRAKTNAAMVEGLRRYRAASGESNAKYHHLTVSFLPSTRFDSADPFRRGVETTKLLLEEVGVYSGVMIYHPWRIAEPYRGEVRGHESGNGDMTWADVLTKVENPSWPWEAARSEFLEYGPHFHVYANAPFVQGQSVTDMIEDRTGVVIHRITKRNSSVSLYDVNDLVSSMAYSFSHAGLAWDGENEMFRAAYRRFGETANFSPTPGVEADVDAALRDAAPEVLGQEFPKPRCDNETVEITEAEEEGEDEAETNDRESSLPRVKRDLSSEMPDVGGWSDGSGSEWSSGNTGGFAADNGEELWAATAGVSPSWLDDPSEAPEKYRSECGAKLVPMWAAPEYLDNEVWVEQIGEEARAELEAAYEEWKRLGEPRAEALPPPDVPDPPD